MPFKFFVYFQSLFNAAFNKKKNLELQLKSDFTTHQAFFNGEFYNIGIGFQF